MLTTNEVDFGSVVRSPSQPYGTRIVYNPRVIPLDFAYDGVTHTVLPDTAEMFLVAEADAAIVQKGQFGMVIVIPGEEKSVTKARGLNQYYNWLVESYPFVESTVYDHSSSGKAVPRALDRRKHFQEEIVKIGKFLGIEPNIEAMSNYVVSDDVVMLRKEVAELREMISTMKADKRK